MKRQIARTGGFCTPFDGESPPAIWALSPLAAPVEALEEILADIQTARPTATGTLLVGPMVGIYRRAEIVFGDKFRRGWC